MIDVETLVNDDVIFEDTGYNMRNLKEQEYLQQIKNLEEQLKQY